MKKFIVGLIAAASVIAAPTAQAHYRVNSTSYCLHGRMADGSYTRPGSVANNFLPLGALVKTDRMIFGRRYFRVRDRIGFGSQFDIWAPSCQLARQYGRRTITIHWVRR